MGCKILEEERYIQVIPDWTPEEERLFSIEVNQNNYGLRKTNMTDNQKRLILLVSELWNMAANNHYLPPTVEMHPEDINELTGTEVFFQRDSNNCNASFEYNQITMMDENTAAFVQYPVRVNSKRQRWVPWIGYK